MDFPHVVRVRSQELHDPQEEVYPQEVASGMKALDKSHSCSSADSLTSQLARAKLVIAENRITHDLKLGAFVVQNSEEKHNVVTLFPKQSCTCPSTSECYHILAAKLSIRFPCRHETTTINLSQLMRNACARKEKKSGRKKPHPGDCTINPAPDSLCSASPIEHCADTELLSFTAQAKFGDRVLENFSDEACNTLKVSESEPQDVCSSVELEMTNNEGIAEFCSYICISLLILLFSSVSDGEMLRVWEDLSRKYRMNY